MFENSTKERRAFMDVKYNELKLKITPEGKEQKVIEQITLALNEANIIV